MGVSTMCCLVRERIKGALSLVSGTKGNDYTHAQVALYRNGTSGLVGRMLLCSTLCAVKPNQADLPCMLTRATFLNSS